MFWDWLLQPAEKKRKHRLGALALLFPIVYNLVDALSIVAMGVTVSGETLMLYGMETVLPENQHVRHTAALYRVTAIKNK